MTAVANKDKALEHNGIVYTGPISHKDFFFLVSEGYNADYLYAVHTDYEYDFDMDKELYYINLVDEKNPNYELLSSTTSNFFSLEELQRGVWAVRELTTEFDILSDSYKKQMNAMLKKLSAYMTDAMEKREQFIKKNQARAAELLFG